MKILSYYDNYDLFLNELYANNNCINFNAN